MTPMTAVYITGLSLLAIFAIWLYMLRPIKED